MNSQLTGRIKERNKAFSKGQKAIAKYIEEHSDKVAFMTAARLGATVGVSESTVVRFATEIGYSGYPALQRAMQEMIRSKLNSIQRLEMTSRNVPKEKLLEMVLEQDVSSIRKTKENIDRESFEKSVEALVGAERVYILGVGSSFAPAAFLFHYFGLMFESVTMIDGNSEAQIFQQMIRISEKDAVVVISFPRYSKRVVKALKYARDNGVATIAVTDSMASPLAKYADHGIFARSDMVSFVDSLVAPMSLINAMIVSVAISKKDQVGDILDKIEKIWDEYGVYEKIDENNEDV